jgi:hypothetical protein
MGKLKSTLFILLALGFGFGASRLEGFSEEEWSQFFEVTEIVSGEMKIVDAGEGIMVLEKSKGGTTPDGDVIESGLVMDTTRIIKFKDGRTTCYMLADEPSGISCVRTSFP